MASETLFDYLARRQPSVQSDSIEARFWAFHEAHPEVYDALVELCRRWCARGRDRWSVDGAFHVLRWERRIVGLPDDHDIYKLNNNLTSRYARLVMEREPDLAGVFEVRELRTPA